MYTIQLEPKTHLPFRVILTSRITQFCVVVPYRNKSPDTDKVDRTVRQLAHANENLTGNVLKILRKSKVKEQIGMHEGQCFVTLNE